jgi:hypothetical protein
MSIALFKGKPSPETIDHKSFHLSALQSAMEDPGDEIGLKRRIENMALVPMILTATAGIQRGGK